MKPITFLLGIMAVLAVVAPAGAQDTIEAVLVAPKVLYVGTPGTLTVTAVQSEDRAPVVTAVSVAFRVDSATRVPVFSGSTDALGRVRAVFNVPAVAAGAYALEVAVGGLAESLEAAVTLREMPVLLIETDKPIYKPGQTIHGRALVLGNDLRPAGDAAVDIEITDGKGVKVFRQELTTNAFGVAPFDLDLATELNFGTWKITAESGTASGMTDLRVEKYVLPRFNVDVLTDKDYFLVDEPVVGSVTSFYFFGKPVDGSVAIRASRYVGVWEEFASHVATLSGGAASFDLGPTGYVSGTVGAGGAGSVQLDVVVTDTSGHEEKSTKLLKIVDSPVQHQIIPTDASIVPGTPFEVSLVAESPDGDLLNGVAELACVCVDWAGAVLSDYHASISIINGLASVILDAPKDTYYATVTSSVSANGGTGAAEATLYASYSPSSSFLHARLMNEGAIRVGDTLAFEIIATSKATVYYDVFAGGQTVWSDAAVETPITFQATPSMAPGAKLVAYIINPNNEISADSVAFEVGIEGGAALDVAFDAPELLPGGVVRLDVQTDAPAMVGLALVDESVYALNEGRLNMQQVFAELESRFMEPQQETHVEGFWGGYGAHEVFEDVGLQVVTSANLSAPQNWRDGLPWFVDFADEGMEGEGEGVPTPSGTGELAEVTRVRQYFPETWLWMPDLVTDANGLASLDLTAPDSITRWLLHAVSTSESGLGIADSSVLVFQEFFGEPDLPYAVTRGEQFPVRVQVFNYLDTAQNVLVELADADWFDLLEPGAQTVTVEANSVGLASFLIEPTRLGRHVVEVTLRSTARADAVRKELLVEAEGTRRDLVTNGVIQAGETQTLDAAMPEYRVADSETLLLSVTPSLVAQSINGIEDLLGMPYGCGEQNMMLFAPDVEVLRYLDATDQLTAEVRAKAEHLITVGYQRQLTFRHDDGSFSAFGESDESGSLWLTAFVLGCFSGAREVQPIDETILAEANAWIEAHQLGDGSWEPVGFICHSEMVGGLEGTYALTAFVTAALAEYGAASPGVLTAAAQYLTNNLSSVNDDAYSLAIAAHAFTQIGDPMAAAAIQRLLELAISDADGLHWAPYDVETTAYVALAMIANDTPQANEAVKWLSLQRNSLGGFSNTQDTVMGLKALMTAAREQTRNVNLTLVAYDASAGKGAELARFTVNATNFDVLQTAELPAVDAIELAATGSGEVRYQLVRRYNVLLEDETIEKDLAIEVEYDAAHVAVDDIVNVNVMVRYFGLLDTTGMMIVDVGVPTGFATVQASLDALLESGAVSRIETAGRKVILYVDELAAGEERPFAFQMQALFPVRAVAPDSKAYLYYKPDVCAEDAGHRITAGFGTEGEAEGEGEGEGEGEQEPRRTWSCRFGGMAGVAGSGGGPSAGDMLVLGTVVLVFILARGRRRPSCRTT